MIRDVKRIARVYVPDVYITSRRLPKRLSRLFMGAAWINPDTGTPMIMYARGLSPRERALTILHELAHHLFDIGTGARGIESSSVREARADRWATGMLEMLEAS